MSEEEIKAIHLLQSYAGMTHKLTDNQGRPKLDQAIEKVLNLIDKLQRQIKIKDNYFDMIYFVGADYDGYKKAKDLKSVIDDLVDYAIKGKNNDDKSQMYMNGSGKHENILFEGIKE